MAAQGQRHSVSVAAAIIEDGKVLVIRRRDNNQWEPPGGVLELNESIFDGLQREVLEETGLLVKPVSLSGVYKNMERGIIALVFRCEVWDGRPRTTEEVTESRWMSPSEIQEQMQEAYACRLLDALTDDLPAIRSHDGVRLVTP